MADEGAVGPGQTSGVVGPNAEEKEAGVRLQLSSGTQDGDEITVLASIIPDEGQTRTKSDVCCVIDVSGSMGMTAHMMGADGSNESHGLCLLDVVKHAVKTIVGVLNPGDRLALVAYNHAASVTSPLLEMTEDKKMNTTKALASMSPGGQTNLWDGLLTGMEILRKAESHKSDRLAAVLLLTDGQPNMAPPRGHIPMLKKYKDTHGASFSCTISTFGFGYNLDSELLRDLAHEGGGMYAFIPDSGFVGTAFVNAISNLLVTVGRNATLALEAQNGAVITKVLGGSNALPTSWGMQVEVGALQYGQSKDVLFKVKVLDKSQPFLAATLTYSLRTNPAEVKLTVEEVAERPTAVLAHEVRCDLIDTVQQAWLVYRTSPDEAKTIVHELSTRVRQAAEESRDATIVAYMRDITGQVAEAVSKPEYMNKWGKHYLLSLCRAHQLQQCNNFKDPGVQGYGGKLFKEIQDQADDIFCKLPAPRAAAPVSRSYSGRAGAAAAQAPVNMAAYNCAGNPCFAGGCLVRMADGSERQVRHVRKGDLVVVPGAASPAAVLCVLKTVTDGGFTPLVCLGDLVVTPYHPLRVAGAWAFPCSLAPVALGECEAVYSFVLASGHVMSISGYECVSLGHSFTAEVVAHPYFGSQRIVRDLAAMAGWGKGLVELRTGCLVRDEDTGLVCGLRMPCQLSSSSSAPLCPSQQLVAARS